MSPVRLSFRAPATCKSFLSRVLPAMAAIVMILLCVSASAGAQVSCAGLCLQQVACSPGVTTSITGTVYAPNGTDPLPNVLVYIPNITSPANLPALPNGVECNPNGEPALGSPLVSTVTAVNGTFTLTNVPVGANIPLVIQAGKWRRIFTVPNVASCTNTLASTASGSGMDTTTVPAGHNIHLPQNQGEGDIPKIAIVTGAVDGVECVLTKMGVATSEFTDPTGTGRINLFLGDIQAGVKVDNSTQSETTLEGNQAALNNYDLVMLPCQGVADDTIYQNHPGYLTNLGAYANAGGRIYATHYSYDLLYTNPAFNGAVNWDLTAIDPANQTAYINTTNNPEGAELSAWLQLVDPQLYPPMGTLSPGQIPVNTIRDNVAGIPSTTQSFLSITSPPESIQFTFPTPVTSPAASQCGRVLYNQYHVEDFDSNPTTGETFPAECAAATPITPQEQLLEYSLFDLGTFTSPNSNPTVSVSFTNSPATLTQGDTADTAAVTVTNTSTTTATNATLQVALTMPAGLTATAIAPAIPTTSGWSCTLGTLTCTRTTGLSAQASDAVIVTFSVAANAISPQTLSATVSNGNLAAPVTATDPILVPLTLSPPSEPLPNASYHVPYSQQFTAGGGDPGYTYSFYGTLPPGLSLNTGTGLLSGTPTAAADGNTYTFNVIVTDSATNSLSQQYTIAVPQVLASSTLTVSSAANPTPGSAVTVPAGATVTATFTLTDTAGLPIAIPAGTSIAATTPSATAVFGAPVINGGTLTETVSDTAAESLTLGVYNLGVPISPATVTASYVPPAYVVTVNTDEAGGSGVASNCVDPNLPTYTSAANANCSLRDAVAAANALSGVTTNIGFSLPNPSTILIAQPGGITISQNVNINGPAASQVTIEGGNTPLLSSNNPILRISNGNVSISGLTFANGYAGPGYNGGAIDFNQTGSGSLTVSNSTFTGNSANNGGALSANYLTVSNSTFTGNQAVYGGAVFSTLLTVSNSTFSGNSAQAGGGAIATVTNLTVSNSIFSGDSATDGSGIYALNGGTVDHIVYNNGDTFSFVTPTNAVNADPKLSPLGYYGGSTPTMLPLPGSSAICAGTVPTLNGNPIPTDQRGVAINGSRYGQTACYDVGAVQTGYALTLGPSPVVPSLVTPGSPISPAPVATVTENGIPLTAGVATVNMADADSDLSGSATVSVPTSIATGQSSFSNLLFTTPESTDTLTATLPLNSNVTPALSLSATSNTFQVGKLTPTIVVSVPSSITYGTPSLTLSAQLIWTGPVMPTGAVTFLIDSTISVPATCTSLGSCSATYNDATTLTGGTHTLTAGIAPDAVYNGATSNSVPLIVNRATPAFMVPSDSVTYGTATVILTATVNVAGSANLTGGVAISVDSGPQFGTSCALTGPHHLSCTANVQLGVLSVGSHTITVSDTGDTNYISASGTGTLTVNPAPLTVTLVGNPTKVYDGTTAATLTSANYQVNGVVSPDVITVTQPTGTYAAANAGPETVTAALTASSFTAATGSLNNYTLPASATGPGTITQASSTTTVICAPTTVVYNGQPQTPCTASVTGVGGLSQAVTPVTYSSNTNAGVNTASATATYTGDTNHTGSTGSATFTILKAPLTVTAGSYSGTYDGNTHALSACVVSNNPDNLTCTNSPAGPVGPDATSGAVVVTPMLSGPTSNYSVTSNNGSYSISPLTVTVTAGGYSGSYDGNTHATSACVSTYAGVTCANSLASVGPGVGNGTVTPVASIAAGNASDYTIATQNSAWSIIPAPSNLSISCPTSVVYNGSAQTPCTAAVTGAGGLSQSVTVGYFSNTNVGPATATATFANPNYLTSTKMVYFAITPALLTVTAGSYAGVYDGNTHALSPCVVSANPDNLTCTNNPVGPVGPDVSGTTVVTPVLSSSASNYTVTSNNGGWSITAKPVTLTAGSYTGVYDGNTHTPSFCTSSYAGVTCTNNPASVGPGVGSNTINPVPSYSTGSAMDYTVNAVPGSGTIAQASSVITLTCTAGAIYNGAPQTPCSASVTGVGLSSQSLTPIYSSNVSAGVNTASATATYGGDINHTGSTKTVTFTILQATPIITWAQPAQIVYGTPLSATQLDATANVSGNFSYNPAAGSTPAVGTDTLSAIFTPSDATDYAAVPASTTISVTASGLRYVAVTPCRIADTRSANGPFGGPIIPANGMRTFLVPNSSCGIPATAQAYALNVTVVPPTGTDLYYLQVAPTGTPHPPTSLINSNDGRIKSVSTIIGAGTSGGVDFYATQATQVVVDITGYYTSAPTALEYYPVAPCRAVDTRTVVAGGPVPLTPMATENFVLAGKCNIPSTAQAYSVNVTGVPQQAKINQLTVWATGTAQPATPLLTSQTGIPVANGTIVKAGTNGSVSILSTDAASVVIDVNGYYAPPGTGGLSLYPITPCRALDTRKSTGGGPFTGVKTVSIPSLGCGVPTSAKAFALNATVQPVTVLDYLTLYPNQPTVPNVSILDAADGYITSNLAVVSTTNGSINAYAPNTTQLVLDVTGYFAP